MLVNYYNGDVSDQLGLTEGYRVRTRLGTPGLQKSEIALLLHRGPLYIYMVGEWGVALFSKLAVFASACHKIGVIAQARQIRFRLWSGSRNTSRDHVAVRMEGINGRGGSRTGSMEVNEEKIGDEERGRTKLGK